MIWSSFSVLLVVLTVFYVLLLIWAIMGLLRHQPIQSPERVDQELISVIVPFRNEAMRIAPLLKSLNEQSDMNFEVVFCNDHSEDDSEGLIREYRNENWLLVPTNVPGKKGAIRRAVSIAKGKILAFTDADCIPNSDWIRSIRLEMGETDFLFGPVITVGEGFFSGIQYVDQLSLSASSVALAKAGIPFMCSGANMATRKEHWPQEAVNGDHRDSGDDVFLLHWMIKTGKRVKAVWHPGLLVSTLPAEGGVGFLKQRLRWAGKGPSYRQQNILGIAFLVAFLNSALLVGGLLTFIHPPLLMTLLICLLLKGGIDYLFLLLSERRIGMKGLSVFFLPAFLFHLAYVPVVAFAALFVKQDWKNRPLK